MSRKLTMSCRSFYDLKNKIDAIKGVRTVTNSSLREAKALVEGITPGHSETLHVTHKLLGHDFSEGVRLIKASGLTVQVSRIEPADEIVRGDIADQIRQIITFATMAAQYDISKSLLDVLETHCTVHIEE